MPSFHIRTNALKINTIMNKKNSSKAIRLEMVEIDHNRFAAEILRGNARINMTQMAKPFGKSFRPAFWLRTEEAQRYIKAIAEVQKCNLADLVEVRNGGIPGTNGTWCNDRRIALRFAQWLSPEFSVLVDDAIMRLMLGEAVYAEAVNGVEPVVHGGRAWYNYRDALESFGLSRKSSAWRRKRAMPQCFCSIYGRNFITKEYFVALKSYYEWKDRCKQLELPFDFDGKEG